MSRKYQVFYPNVYTPEQEAALNGFKARLPIDMWGCGVSTFPAEEISKDDLSYYANANFEKLRLYGAVKRSMGPPPLPDEATFSTTPVDYGKRSKYGSCIAAPFFGDQWTIYPQMFLRELGNEWIHCKDYGCAEFFLPIYPGDTLTTRLEMQSIEDITASGGSALRVFKVTGKQSVYNQKGQLVWTQTVNARNAYRNDLQRNDDKLVTLLFLPHAVPDGRLTEADRWNTTCGAYVQRRTFTKEDWSKIIECDNAERIRGDAGFTFDDANEGDDLGRVCTPAVTLSDMLNHCGPYFKDSPRKREIYIGSEGIENFYGITTDSNGCPYMLFEYNMVDHIDGYYLGDIPDTYLRNLIVRLIMNYAGDDGWLSKIEWYTLNRHLGAPSDAYRLFTKLVPELRGKAFDFVPTFFDSYSARGVVVKKYEDNGVCKLDIVCWTESFDGGLCLPARATVILPRRQGGGQQ